MERLAEKESWTGLGGAGPATNLPRDPQQALTLCAQFTCLFAEAEASEVSKKPASSEMMLVGPHPTTYHLEEMLSKLPCFQQKHQGHTFLLDTRRGCGQIITGTI